MRENYCYSCNLQLCNKCFQTHTNTQQHIYGNKRELQAIVQNEINLLTQREQNIEEFAISHDLLESQITSSKEKKEYIEFYTKLYLKDMDSVKLGLISRMSLREGKDLQKELKKIRREYQELLNDLEQGIVDICGMFAIRIIDEERYQYYAVTSSEELKISDDQREEFLNKLNEVENKILIDNKGEMGSTSNIDQIFKIIFILFGIILSCLIISIVIYSFLRANKQGNLNDKKFKLKEKTKFYNSRIYERNILDKNITLLIERSNSQIKHLKSIKLNVSGKREQFALKKEEIIFLKSNISKIIPNIESLLQSKILSNKEYLNTLQVQDNSTITNKFSFNLIRNLWIILTNSGQPPLKFSHEDLLKYSELIRYWTAYNYIGGIFIIVSGTELHGISIIWYEAHLLLKHIPREDINIGLHRLIENGEILVVGAFPVTLYYFNMSNCLIIHEKRLFDFQYIWLLDYNPLNPSNLEIIAGTEQTNFINYNYKISSVSNNITLDFEGDIHQVFQAGRLSKIIISMHSKLFGYSIETGSELQEYNNELYMYSSNMIELTNNKLGYIAQSYLIIVDIDTLTFVEVFETNTGDNIFYKTVGLSPDRNIFLTKTSDNGDYSIIKFDTRTVLWSGEIRYYKSQVTAATQVKENIFIYADSDCMLWIIDIITNVHLLFIDVRKYEKEEFNYHPKNNSFIKIISVIERDSSSTYTIEQI